MAARPRLVTFDVYTALVDCEGGLVPIVRDELGEEAVAFVRAWRAKQLEYAQLTNSLPGGRLSFRLVTRRALAHTFARFRRAVEPALAEGWLAAWDALPAWPEAEATLATLASRGYALALLSNGDEEMLRALAATLRVRFDHFFGSDQAGRYKPHPAIYALPRERAGVEPADMLHVAGSGNDVLGAKLSGLRCAWSNRTGDRVMDPGVAPDHEMADLAGLLEVLP